MMKKEGTTDSTPLPLQYEAPAREPVWYAYWLEQALFRSAREPGGDPFVVIMPPPNVTGRLHLGHVLNNAIQDVLVRRARMKGREVCWVPGLDHASIATEAKVTELLSQQGIRKGSLTREEFLAHAWEWKEKYGGIIVEQLRKLGLACDWERFAFTMDEQPSAGVTEAFVRLYEQGYIYRGLRMVHWDPAGRTALSDDEVVYREVEGALYYIRYPFADGSEGGVVVATTRPETLFGDMAVCIHPDDARYSHLTGRQVVLPFTGRQIPVIADSYVDPALGSGCLKVTPAHDANDYQIGLRHALPILEILTPDGHLNEHCGVYTGMERMEARKKVAEALRQEGLLEKVVAHTHQVGFSERTHVPVEPRPSTQWFVSMQELARPALDAVEDGTIRFHPARFRNMYRAWMEDVHDWCISRQLYWGHRIPAYYLPDGRYVVARTPREAEEKARQLTGEATLSATQLRQDEDVLDTWFSSWLWPITLFDGMLHPDSPELARYYPTHDLVTAPEIIFFWVARMIMAGYAFTGKPPFRDVYFTGIVRDKLGRKMSKSLGNSPEPLELMDTYTTDGVRAGMLFCAPAGNDLIFDEKLCGQGSRFVHKIWNALRLVHGWVPVERAALPAEGVAGQWFGSRLQEGIARLEEELSAYRLSEGFVGLYKLIWDEFCAHYLEMVKPVYPSCEVSSAAYAATLGFFRTLMQLLHPFMPFITEEVWHQLAEKDGGTQGSILLSGWPQAGSWDQEILEDARAAFALLTRLKQMAAHHPGKKLTLLQAEGSTLPGGLVRFFPYVQRRARLAEIVTLPADQMSGYSFAIGDQVYRLPQLDEEADRGDLRKSLEQKRTALEKTRARLANPAFLEKAPADLVAGQRQRLEELHSQIEALEKLVRE